MSVTGHNRRRRQEAAALQAQDDAVMAALAEEEKKVAEIEAKGLDPELCLMTTDELVEYVAKLSDDYVVDRRKSPETIVREIMALEAVVDEVEETEEELDEVKDVLLIQLDNYQDEEFGFGDKPESENA